MVLVTDGRCTRYSLSNFSEISPPELSTSESGGWSYEKWFARLHFWSSLALAWGWRKGGRDYPPAADRWLPESFCLTLEPTFDITWQPLWTSPSMCFCVTLEGLDFREDSAHLAERSARALFLASKSCSFVYASVTASSLGRIRVLGALSSDDQFKLGSSLMSVPPEHAQSTPSQWVCPLWVNIHPLIPSPLMSFNERSWALPFEMILPPVRGHDLEMRYGLANPEVLNKLVPSLVSSRIPLRCGP